MENIPSSGLTGCRPITSNKLFIFMKSHFVLPAEVEEYVIKAQVHAGGRGLGVFDTGFKSGVHLTKE